MIPVSELRAAAGLAATDTTRDDALIATERAAVEYVQGRTGRYFGPPKEFTEILAGGENRLFLTETPVADPAIVVETKLADWTEVDAADYENDGKSLYYANSGLWPGGSRTVRVTYTAGYTEGEEPADIRAAVMAVAVAMWKGQKSGGMKSESIGGYSYTLAAEDELPPFVRAILGRWTRARI